MLIDTAALQPKEEGSLDWQLGSSLKFTSDVCVECWCHDHSMMGESACGACFCE